MHARSGSPAGSSLAVTVPVAVSPSSVVVLFLRKATFSVCRDAGRRGGQDLRHACGHARQYAALPSSNVGPAAHAGACPEPLVPGSGTFQSVLFVSPASAVAAALSETEYAFTHLNTEKEVAQAVRNAFVKKVRTLHMGQHYRNLFLAFPRPLVSPSPRALSLTSPVPERCSGSTTACGTASSAATLART